MIHVFGECELDETRFELFAYLEGRPTQLLDTWTVSQ